IISLKISDKRLDTLTLVDINYFTIELGKKRRSTMAKPDPKLNVLRQQGTLNPHAQAVADELFQKSDFFDPRDIVQVKYEMLRKAQIDKATVSHCADLFGFSRPSFYQARIAFDHSGLTGLLPQKRGPRRAHKLSSEVMAFIRKARTDQSAVS